MGKGLARITRSIDLSGPGPLILERVWRTIKSTHQRVRTARHWELCSRTRCMPFGTKGRAWRRKYFMYSPFLPFSCYLLCTRVSLGHNHLSLTDISNAGAGRKDTCYTSSHQYDPNARERAPHKIHIPALKPRHVRRQITIYYTEDMFGFFSRPRLWRKATVADEVKYERCLRLDRRTLLKNLHVHCGLLHLSQQDKNNKITVAPTLHAHTMQG